VRSHFFFVTMAFPQKIEDLELGKKLGKGFFAEVVQGRERCGNKRMFAVKKIKRSVVAEHNLNAQIQREIQIMYSTQHDRIVNLHFNFEDSRFIYLGLEFANGGTLFDQLNKARKFTPAVASRYFGETCDALNYLHSLPEKVIHRDIKPENLLLHDDHIKLADFGWANLMQGSARETFCGTLDYLAPEMIQGTGHDESVDMWNMGVLLYELVTGQSPFGSTTKEATCRLILNVDLRFPTDIHPDAKNLVSCLCKKEAKDRLTASQALSHVFVMSFNGGQGGGVEAAVAEEDVSRPSVVVRRLRKDREKLSSEMQYLLQAKQRTEDAFMTINQKIDETHAALQKEKMERQKLEAMCSELKRANSQREAELETERKKLADLQAEKSKLGDRILTSSSVSRRARA